MDIKKTENYDDNIVTANWSIHSANVYVKGTTHLSYLVDGYLFDEMGGEVLKYKYYWDGVDDRNNKYGQNLHLGKGEFRSQSVFEDIILGEPQITPEIASTRWGKDFGTVWVMMEQQIGVRLADIDMDVRQHDLIDEKEYYFHYVKPNYEESDS